MAFVIPKDITSSCFQTYLYPTPKACRIALLLHSTFILHSTENSTFSAGSFLNQRQQYSLFQPPAQELALGRPCKEYPITLPYTLIPRMRPHHSPLHPQDVMPQLREVNYNIPLSCHAHGCGAHFLGLNLCFEIWSPSSSLF